MSKDTLLRAENLKTYFQAPRTGLFKKNKEQIKAVNDVSFTLKQGESLGLVGESGCGKSTLARTLVRLIEPYSGKIIYKEHDITRIKENKLRKLRSKFQIIFQNPYASLNPRMNILNILTEPLKEFKIVSRKAIYREVCELIDSVGLSKSQLKKYPHEFSGGQLQRIAIARAVAVKPELLLADEPVSALDVSVQSQILNLINSLKRNNSFGLIFISHNLAVVRYIANKVAVMYLGRIVEIGTTSDVYDNPMHPYTNFLLSAIPVADPEIERNRKIMPIKGPIPSPISQPAGCSFHPRCPRVTDLCREKDPELEKKSTTHNVACHNS